MDELLRRYARLIIEVQLKLERGDALSINTESNTMAFARMLATMACETTLQTVTIVETNHGKVVQVVEFDPTERRIKRPQVTGYVMCHLFDLDNAPYLSDEKITTITEEVSQLGSFGLLSDPVFLDRRIAVPWANVPLPGPLWAMQLLDKAASEEDMWLLFSKLFRLEDDQTLSFWFGQSNLLHYRKQALSKLGQLQFTLKGDSWHLEATMAERTTWSGGRHALSGGRTFMPHLPMQHIQASLDHSSAQGNFSASKPFLLLGKLVEDATFVIENGKVVSFAASQGKEALTAFFAIDEGASVLSALSLADNDTIESRYLSKAVHPHFNKEITTSLVFGGFSLTTLTDQASDEEIDESRLTRSLVRMEVPIGNAELTVGAKTLSGIETLLMEEGVFAL